MMAAASPNYIPSWVMIAEEGKFTVVILMILPSASRTDIAAGSSIQLMVSVLGFAVDFPS